MIRITWIIVLILGLFTESMSVAETDSPQKKSTLYLLVLLSGPSYNPLNDTGITWGGDYPDNNNETCTSNISSPQDCHQGRDFTHDDDSDGHAGFNYTKISSTGAALSAIAATWSCVRDNVTGLTWEVKTDDGGIHDKDNTYRWGGKTHLGSGYGTYYDDWDILLDGSNTQSLCGSSDWRVPNIMELMNLANRGSYPAIDTDYFPNTTPVTAFWSAMPSAFSSDYAWALSFSLGTSNDNLLNRDDNGHVRLVRGRQ